ncbi:hypothetical protein AMURIS_03335 [Acetatifactor muris]|uniref:Uncharacterized protein n=2 Tax=Acetatifactor muris TaxID=879566 RepID=A0A2K4ZJE9_9FIRM|nr:hypothetical protein AMURIS_03335 [Acetatifactor muris]
MTAHVCTTGNTAGIMGVAAHICASRYAAVMIPMTVISRVGIAVLAVMHVSRSFGTSRNAASAVAVFTGLCTAVNAAKSVCVSSFQSATRYTAVVISMTVIRRVGIAVLAVVHVSSCFGTTRNAAGAVAVLTGLCTAVNAAGAVGVFVFQSATCYTAVMIPMTVISRVGIAVLAVMHVSRSFGTSRNIAGVMAVFTGLCTAVDAAGAVGVFVFQSTTCHTAVMIPMTVISRVGIAVLAVMHVSRSFGTSRNAASAVAVLAGLGTADNSTKAVLMYFCLCASQNRAGNIHLIFLCSTLDFRGTLVYCIGDNTACYHGNGYERNG